jgi:hypothetical protein
MENDSHFPEDDLEHSSGLNFEQQRAINELKDTFIGDLLYKISNREIHSCDDLREALTDCYVDETAVMDLSITDQIDLIEQYGDEYELHFEGVTPDTIRFRIAVLSTFVVGCLAENETLKSIQNLEDFMIDYELEFKNIVYGNAHGWARHWDERMEGDHCQVYEYRNLEHEQIHIDVWEYRRDGWELTFETHLSPKEVSYEENHFDAS